MEGEQKEGRGERKVQVLIEQVRAYSETQCVHLLYMKWP